MALTSLIIDYKSIWPTLFDQEAERLRPIFDDAIVDLHHVGSTAVVGMSAKPEIDVLVVVVETDGLDRWTRALAILGYIRGKDLETGHHFFRRDVDGIRTHKLHICQIGHSQVSRMLEIRDHLRINREDRKAYQDLKLRLERANRNGIAEYLDGKAPFLDDLYRKIQ